MAPHRAFEIPRSHKVMRTGTVLRYLFFFAWNYVINFENTLLAEGFGHLDPAASSGLDSRIGTCRLNRARRTTLRTRLLDYKML